MKMKNYQEPSTMVQEIEMISNIMSATQVISGNITEDPSEEPEVWP